MLQGHVAVMRSVGNLKGLSNTCMNFVLLSEYGHHEFQFPLLDTAHCVAENQHQVSNGSLIGLFSLFIL